jgi:hypothetical protein
MFIVLHRKNENCLARTKDRSPEDRGTSRGSAYARQSHAVRSRSAERLQDHRPGDGGVAGFATGGATVKLEPKDGHLHGRGADRRQARATRSTPGQRRGKEACRRFFPKICRHRQRCRRLANDQKAAAHVIVTLPASRNCKSLDPDANT